MTRYVRRSLGGHTPRVTLHYAQTLDGRIAARDGSSRWISGEESLRFAHELRASHDAVMVGVGTVVADDPRLTVRLVPGRSPCRVIVDSSLRVPLGANVVADGAAPTLVATTRRAAPARLAALRERDVETVVVDEDGEGRVDLTRLLEALGGMGLRSILIEGGRGLITSALRDRLVDRIVICVAPKILGEGVEAIGDLRSSCLGDAIHLDGASITRRGEDLIIDAALERIALGA